MTLTQAELKSRLHYNPDTGKFSWRYCADRSAAWNRRYAGKQAGTLMRDRGQKVFYVLINISGKVRRAHRLAWFYVHGEWPDGQIDHINGDGIDNRIANLRVATPSINAFNRRGLEERNTSGHTGVNWYRRYLKWRAFIKHNGKFKNLGYFDSLEDAVTARKAAEQEYFPGIKQHQQNRGSASVQP